MGKYKHTCTVCGMTVSLSAPGYCLDEECTGRLVRVYKRKEQTTIKCIICGELFVPRHSRQLAHGGECSHKRRLEMAVANTRRRYADRVRRPVSKPTSWGWLQSFGDESALGKRTILHTLEDQTASGTWPYYDVLAGVAPCPIDQCAFL